MEILEPFHPVKLIRWKLLSINKNSDGGIQKEKEDDAKEWEKEDKDKKDQKEEKQKQNFQASGLQLTKQLHLALISA